MVKTRPKLNHIARENKTKTKATRKNKKKENISVLKTKKISSQTETNLKNPPSYYTNKA